MSKVCQNLYQIKKAHENEHPQKTHNFPMFPKNDFHQKSVLYDT